MGLTSTWRVSLSFWSYQLKIEYNAVRKYAKQFIYILNFPNVTSVARYKQEKITSKTEFYQLKNVAYNKWLKTTTSKKKLFMQMYRELYLCYTLFRGLKIEL